MKRITLTLGFLSVLCHSFGQTVASPSINHRNSATGSITLTYSSAYNANTSGVVFSWSWNASTLQWVVTCASGPSTGWAAGTTLNSTGTPSTYTTYGQNSSSYSANAAITVAINSYGSPISSLTLPANGPVTMINQTITISPASITVAEGQSVNFVVTGHSTPLVISSVTGGFGTPASLVFGGSTFTEFETGSSKSFTVSAYAQADSTHNASNTVVGTVTVTRSLKVKKWLPANNTKATIVYTARQGAVIVGTHTMAPGAVDYLWTINTLTTETVSIEMTLTGVKEDGVTHVTDPSSTTTIPDPSVYTPTTNPVVPGTNPNPSTPSQPPPGTKIPQIWSPGNGGVDDLLTNQVYREGIDRLTDTTLPEVPDQSEAVEAAVTAGDAATMLNDAQDVRDNLNDQQAALQSIKPLLPSVSGQAYVYQLPIAAIDYTLTVDLSQFSGPISLMRLVVKLLFLGFMWFVYMRTLRSSQV